MPARFAVVAALLLPLASCSAPPSIAVSDAWARATVAGQPSAAAYLTIANKGGESDRLVSVSSTAGEASLHSTSMDGGVMRMRAMTEGLDVPAGATVKLAPGGTHVMLAKLPAPLAKGSAFPLTLKFERSGDKSVSVRVLDPAAAGAGMENM